MNRLLAAVAVANGARIIPARAAGPIALFLAGDVMTARGVDQVLPHPGDARLVETFERSALDYVDLAEQRNGPIPRPVDFGYIWGDALAVLERTAPALRLVNLETSVTTSSDAWPDKAIHYHMNPANTPCLTAAAIDGCALANNHVLDYGHAGLRDTLQALHRAGIRTAGAGNDLDEAAAPAVFETAGGRVLLFAAATDTSGVPREWAAGSEQAGVYRIEPFPWFAQYLSKRVHAVKRPGDIAILSLHWGGNWGYEVDSQQREFARQLIDKAGVDLVFGHSSHHPRGIEIYRNKAILYGCGDLINDYEGIRSESGTFEQYRSDLRLMYFPALDPASGEIQRFEIVPMRMRRFRLERATEEEAAWLAATLDRESRKMGARATLRPDGRIELEPLA